MMKVYFIGSPRAVVKEPELYKKMYKYLEKDNEMLSDLIKEKNIPRSVYIRELIEKEMNKNY